MGTRTYALFALKRFLESERYYTTRGISGVDIQDDGSYRVSLYHLGSLNGGEREIARLTKRLNPTVRSNMKHGIQGYMRVR
jgi:hypothetical protein